MRVALLLTLTAIAFADEAEPTREKILFDLKGADAEALKAYFKESHGIDIEFAEQCSGRKVDVLGVELTPKTAMERVATAFDCKALQLDKKRWRIGPAWQVPILKKIDATDVGAQFKESAAADVVEFVRTMGVPVVLDPGVKSDRKVTCLAEQTSIRKILEEVTKPDEMRWVLRYGAVFVSTRDRLARMPVHSPKVALERRMLMLAPMKDLALVRACTYLTTITGIRIVPEKGLVGMTVSAVSPASQIRFDDALALLLYPQGLTATQEKNQIRIHPRK